MSAGDNYRGKTIKLYPADRYMKEGKIVWVDEYGWLIRITKCADVGEYKVGELRFISHSTPFTFRIVEEDGEV